MFVRLKSVGTYRYLQIVENRYEGGRTRQRVICTLGRADQLMAGGQTDVLLRSLARFGDKVRIVDGYRSGQLEGGRAQQIGPDRVFGRLWETTGIRAILDQLLSGRGFEFPVERAVYLTVLHRIFESGSDRRARKWRRDVDIPGSEGLDLHHLYRAMSWLGGAKNQVEEMLFAARRDLFTELSLTFFDTTSLYFHGAGGATLGQYGHSKDHRPDLQQMVWGVVLTEKGRPVGSEHWAGNHSDKKALLPVVDRMRGRFGLNRVCWVADRGMISQPVIQALEDRELEYILGAPMRKLNEVRKEALGRAGRYREVAENLRVKEVRVEGRRYVVCYNPHEALKDAADRQAIVKSLEDELRQGGKQLVGNRGYRRYLRLEKDALTIDQKKIAAEARYDGKYVLRTNTTLSAEEVALQYKRLILVEQLFRAAKSLLETRPIFHQKDRNIEGHVFCSFLALVLIDELQRRLNDRGWDLEWDDVRRDLAALQEVEVRDGQDHYLLRTELVGAAGKVLQAAGVAIPPTVRPAPGMVPKA